MIDSSRTDASSALLMQLHVLTALFSDDYPITRNWLKQKFYTKADDPNFTNNNSSSESETSAQTLSPRNDPATKREPRRDNFHTAHKQPRKPDRQNTLGKPLGDKTGADQLWPALAHHVRRLQKEVKPAEWAKSQGLGMRLQYHEEGDLIKTLSANLNFPSDKAGPMGLLINFVDSWQALDGKIDLFFYHPREPNATMALVDVVRNDQLMAQFEVQLSSLTANSLMNLLPKAWRKRH